MVTFQWIAAWALLAATGAEPVATTAPAERSWGKSQAGVAVSIAAEGDWRLDGAMKLSVAVRNRGAMAVTLPAAEEFFGYLMIRQRDTTWYTEKIHHARGAGDWRRELAAGKALTLPVTDVAALQAFGSKRGLLLRGGYPTEMRGGKRHVVQRKLYPGYVIVQVVVDEHGSIPQGLWQIIRETSGVGDFIGAEKPWPMSDSEVARILGQTEEVQEEAPKLKIDLREGQMIQIKEGPFKSVEGYVEEVNPASGKVKVVINIFNRATPVELEYWQVQVL